MVNSALTNSRSDDPVSDPEVRLAIAYARAATRPVLNALWSLDARLAGILRTTTEPMIGQMRLTWWFEAAAKSDAIAGEPVLAALTAADVAPAASQRIIEGWEALLEGEDDDALLAYATGRGGGLFAAAAACLRVKDRVEEAGAAWALVDLARHHSRPDVARRALKLASERMSHAPTRLSKAARPLAMLKKLTRRDLAGPEPQGSPRRIGALLALALTGH